ncbi:MAG: type II toxin-antitoxin system VapC family toxin [Actinobacteria bacterium]|nr:type II toxin-antitoxin system VapC family toxin [Actinomycetota bacterium]
MYLDASALVKLVVPESQSAALAAYVERRSPLSSCALARVEVVRAVSPHGEEPVRTARELLDEIDLIQLDDELLDLAAELQGPLRSLDAIHLAAALELGDALEAVVTYDGQMTRAAEVLGLTVVAPV